MGDATAPTDRGARRPIAATLAYYVGFIALGLTTASLGPTLPGLAEQTQTRLGEISFLFTARSFGYLLGSFCGRAPPTVSAFNMGHSVEYAPVQRSLRRARKALSRAPFGGGATGIIAGCNQTRNKRRARLRHTRGLASSIHHGQSS